MALDIGGAPVNEPALSFAVQEWMLQVERMLNNVNALSWDLLDLTSSDINDLGGSPLLVTKGGTGRLTSTTAYGLLAAGTTATGVHQTLAAGATTELLVGGGASALPVWTTATGSGAPVRANTPTLITPILGVATATSLQSVIGNITPAAGSFTTISASGQITSTLAIGTAPFAITSTTKVTNLNVDLLDDQSGAYYLDSANFTGTNWTDLTDGGTTTLHTHTSGTASAITVANEATDTTCFPVFVTAATGDLGPKSNTGLTFNSNTQQLGIVSLTASGQLTSTLITGTAPLVIASTTKVTNLNADLLDDQSGAYYLDSANFTGTNWTDLTDTGATTLHKHDHGGMDGLADNDHPQYLLVSDIDDVAVNGEVAQPISSNWAFDHVAAADPHTGYRLESADHTHQSTGAEAGQLDHGLALTGLTDDDHGHYWNYARGAARVSLRI